MPAQDQNEQDQDGSSDPSASSLFQIIGIVVAVVSQAIPVLAWVAGVSWWAGLSLATVTVTALAGATRRYWWRPPQRRLGVLVTTLAALAAIGLALVTPKGQPAGQAAGPAASSPTTTRPSATRAPSATSPTQPRRTNSGPPAAPVVDPIPRSASSPPRSTDPPPQTHTITPTPTHTTHPGPTGTFDDPAEGSVTTDRNLTARGSIQNLPATTLLCVATSTAGNWAYPTQIARSRWTTSVGLGPPTLNKPEPFTLTLVTASPQAVSYIRAKQADTTGYDEHGFGDWPPGIQSLSVVNIQRIP